MKKTILLTLLFTQIIVYSSFSAENKKEAPPHEKPKTTITTLTVNADVTVVLVNSKNQQVNMTGDAAFMNTVSFRQMGDNLVIGASKRRNFKSSGTIYVPAGSLETIRINSAANIKSAGILEIPDLKIDINGDCNVHILTKGKVSPESAYYEFDYYARDLMAPVPFANKN